MSYTTVFPLPGSVGTVPLTLTLRLVERLEAETSLLKTAERLAARDLKISDMAALLRIAYAEAGLSEVSDDFLLQQAPALLLAELLLAILSPLGDAGVLTPGKLPAVAGL